MILKCMAVLKCTVWVVTLHHGERSWFFCSIRRGAIKKIKYRRIKLHLVGHVLNEDEKKNFYQ